MQYTDIISKRSVNKKTHKILLIQKKTLTLSSAITIENETKPN